MLAHSPAPQLPLHQAGSTFRLKRARQSIPTYRFLPLRQSVRETAIPWALISLERVEGQGPDSLAPPHLSQKGRAQALGWALSPSTQPASHITLNYQFSTQCTQSPTPSRVEHVSSCVVCRLHRNQVSTCGSGGLPSYCYAEPVMFCSY